MKESRKVEESDKDAKVLQRKIEGELNMAVANLIAINAEHKVLK